MDLVGLLIGVIVLGVIAYIITVLPINGVFKNIAWVILGLIALLWLLGVLGVGPGIGFGHYG